MELKERIIRKPELHIMVGLSDPTIWRLEKAGKFPGRLRLGGSAVGWMESEILDWLREKADARSTKRSRVTPEKSDREIRGLKSVAMCEKERRS
jgi:prophage regulatory protein